MTDAEFLAFCKSIYDQQLAETDRLYARYPLLISGLVLIGGALVATTHLEAVRAPLGWLRFLHASAVLTTVLLLSVSAYHIVVSMWPREYRRIAPPIGIQKWRTSQTRWTADTSPTMSLDDVAQAVSKELVRRLTDQAIEAVDYNRTVNKDRSSRYCDALRLCSLSLAPLLLTAITHLFL